MPRASSSRPSNPSVPRASNVSVNQSSATDLPQYQPLQYALDEDARQAIAVLATKYELSTMETNLDAAAQHISNAVGDINDRLAEQDAKHQKRKKRRVTTAEDDDQLEDGIRALEDEQEQQIEWTRTQVNEMTKRLGITMRRTIDSREGVTTLDRVLKELQRNVAGQAEGSNTQTTGRGTQRSLRVTQPGSTMDTTEEEDENSSDRTPVPILKDFEGKLERARDLYESKSMRERYAEHNMYVLYQRILHDAIHSQKPEGAAPALEDSRYWFREEEGGSPAPGNTRAAGEDEDDDIAIARHTISTRCPITLLPYVEPVTSVKCPHSFERENIVAMIRRAPTHAPGRRGANHRIRQEVVCPVVGCDFKLGEEDLKEDPVLIRQIKRIQKQKELRQQRGYVDGEEDEDGRRRVVEEIVDDDDDDEEDYTTGAQDRMETQHSARIFKRERTTQSRTQDEDIEDDDDDDD